MAIGSSIRSAVGTLWRGVLSAVGKGQSSAETASNLQEAFSAAGIPPPAGQVQLVDQLTGLANDWISATSAVRAATGDQNVTSAMVTTAPWSMPLADFNASPQYHIVVGINIAEQPEPVYRTITGMYYLPDTVGELRDLALANAHAMSIGTTPGGGVGGTVTGIGDITVTVAPSGA